LNIFIVQLQRNISYMVHGTYNIIHYMISIMDYLEPLPIQFKMRGSASQVFSGYLNFGSNRALFCYVRRSKSLIECGSFVISFTEMLVFPVQTNCQLPCHIQIYFVAVFNSNMAPFLQLLVSHLLLLL